MIMRNSTCEFETRAAVQKDEEEDCSLSLITTLHRPQTPGKLYIKYIGHKQTSLHLFVLFVCV